MSFKGIITKGEYDRGITLNAKVVAPNKKYSSKQDFPVVIKANALSDREKCLIALNDHKASILALGSDLNNLTYDIMDKFIEGDPFGYKTSSVYSVSSPLSNYLSNAGTIIGFPKYGSEDVTGTIAITTSINDVSMTTHIPVTIKSLTATDVLNDERLNTVGLWSTISNGQEQSNVFKALSLQSTISLTDVSDTPISVTWNITDTALSILNAYSNPDLGYTNLNYNKRINETTGEIFMIPYPVAYGSQANLANAEIAFRANNTSSAASQVRSFSIGGIVLKATLSLTGSEETVIRTFNPMVRTELLTGSEILQIMNISSDKLFQFVVTGNQEYNRTFPVNSSLTPSIIPISSAVDSTLTFRVKANGENIAVPQYDLTSIISLYHDPLPRILIGNVNPSSSGTEYDTTYPGIFTVPTNDGNGNYSFTLNSAALKTLSETQSGATKFTIALNYATAGYPINGTNISAGGGIGTQTGNSYICFEVSFTNE